MSVSFHMYSCGVKFTVSHRGHERRGIFNDFFYLFFFRERMIVRQFLIIKKKFNQLINVFILGFSGINTGSFVAFVAFGRHQHQVSGRFLGWIFGPFT